MQIKLFSLESNPINLLFPQHVVSKISEVDLKMIQRKNDAHVCVELIVCKIEEKSLDPFLITTDSKVSD